MMGGVVVVREWVASAVLCGSIGRMMAERDGGEIFGEACWRRDGHDVDEQTNSVVVHEDEDLRAPSISQKGSRVAWHWTPRHISTSTVLHRHTNHTSLQRRSMSFLYLSDRHISFRRQAGFPPNILMWRARPSLQRPVQQRNAVEYFECMKSTARVGEVQMSIGGVGLVKQSL